MDRLEQPDPDHRRCDAWRELHVRRQGSVAEVVDAVGRLAERRRLATSKRNRHLFVRDPHLALGRHALDPKILELHAIGRLGNTELFLRGEGLLVGFGPRRDRHAEEHRDRLVVRPHRRTPASILQVALLATPGVEQRPEPVRSERRGRCRHPGLPEQPVAEIEILLAFEIEVSRRMRKGVAVRGRLRGAGAGRHALEDLGPGEVSGGRCDLGDPRLVRLGQVGPIGEVAACRRGGDDQKERQEKSEKLDRAWPSTAHPRASGDPAFHTTKVPLGGAGFPLARE